MHKKNWLFLLALIPALLIMAGPAQASTVVYNMYATDGYMELADGTPIYIYGFIGGRDTAPLVYTTGFSRAGGTPTNGTLASTPTPTAGPWTGQDSTLAGNAQFPAPMIYATVGDVVEIRLKNLGVAAQPTAPNDPHSIHLHGLDVDAANDGVPETSVGAVPANLYLCDDGSTATHGQCANNAGAPGETGTPAPGAGNVIVYMFTATNPGTYMYHCHQEADIHVNMGMYGALVIYNTTDAARFNGPGVNAPGQSGGTLFNWKYDKDYVLLLGEMDIRGHADEEGEYGPGRAVVPATWDFYEGGFNWAHYKPQYWQVNGLSFPQSIHAAFPSGYTFADWVAAHPGYDPLINGSVSMHGPSYAQYRTNGEKVLIRMINLGFETQPMHMHGYHGKIIGSDQRGWSWVGTPGFTKFGVGLEKQTLTIGSGETYEWLVDFGQQSFQSTYPGPTAPTASGYPGTYTRYDDTGTNFPLLSNALAPAIPENGDPGAGNTYVPGPPVAGLTPLSGGDFAGLTGSQYFPFHNHDDYKATNNGVYPGGMFTFLVPTP